MDRQSVPNQPVETFRDGRLKASIWQNQSKDGDYHTVTLAKTYEDKQGRLQDSHSFSASELLRVAELAREAHGFIKERARERNYMQERKAEISRPNHDMER